ncbi:hypothetical protein [Thermoproteus uzoniensis]|uniref:hypothetical protein n=1 Tax=Thermoproteus uzoniensis TaxID=184117 RepID=UPI00069C9FF9|nr:hypothetical protein [Thermoproteus uzoniensis]
MAGLVDAAKALAAAAAVSALLAALAVLSGSAAPGISVAAYLNGSPVPAFVQAFAALPPSHRRALVEIWNGTATYGTAKIPLAALADIAREWAEKGYGQNGVGLEIIATYVNGNKTYYKMLFITYKPKDLIDTLENPLLAASRLNYATVRLDLETGAPIASGAAHPRPASTATNAQAPTPPAPPGCWWELIGSSQTQQTQIPITWIFDTSSLSGTLSAYSQQTTSAVINFLASAGFIFGASAAVNYRFIGASAQTSAAYFEMAFVGPAYGNEGAYIYQVGTIGLAEFQLYCGTYDRPQPQDQYAYEAFIDAVAGNLYVSYDLSYISSILAQYNYTGSSILYAPFDEAHASGGGPGYKYPFSSIQSYNQPFGLIGTIPVGAIAARLIGVPEGWPAYLLLNLVAGMQASDTQVSIIGLGLSSSTPAYADVFAAAVPAPYTSSTGYSYFPYILGFNATPPGHYSSTTSTYLTGPVYVYGCAAGGSNGYYTYTAYVQIGGTPLLVPGGTVYAYLYDQNGNLVWSGQVTLPSSDYGTVNGVPMHQPAVIDIPDVFNYGPFGTPYTLYVYYAGYTTPYGTIEYGPSSAQMTIYAVYRC